MQRGTILLAWLALAASVPPAWGDQPPAAAAPAARSAAPPAIRAPLDPMPGRVRHDVEVAPAAYVAQAGIPGEPLGFSATQFNPNPGPIVDPGISSGAAYGPEYEDFDSFNPAAPPAATSGEWLRNGCWYVDAAALYLQRSSNVKNDVPLSFVAADPGNPFEVPTDLGYDPGMIITLGRYLGRDVKNRDHSMEMSFMGLTHWGYSESVSSEDGLIGQVIDPFETVPVYSRSTFQSVDQTSDFNSYEFNYRVDWRLGRDRVVYSRDNKWIREADYNWVCSMLAGVRAVFVNESTDWFAATDGLGTGSYYVKTHNNMVGPQVGAELFYDHAYWRAGVRTRAGGLVNWASQSSTVRIVDDNGTALSPARDEYAKNHSMSFAGGVSLLGEYRFKPNFGIRASYDLLWVTDLALSQNQLTFLPSTPAGISDSHSLFFQGFTFGFQWFR